jgi:hypothetical protein
MKTWRFARRGQTLVLATISLVALIGISALTVDIGMLYSTRRRMQTAADAAVVAAATALRDGQSVTNSATDVSSLNAFTNGKNNVVVKVNNPPSSGAYAGNSSYVEVIITQPQPTYFLRALGYTLLGLSARAVSGGISGPACIYALNPSANNAVYVNGNGTLAGSCGMIVDSSSSAALYVNGNDTINMQIAVVGNYVANGSISFSPQPKTKVASLPDPLAYLQPPTVGACNHNNFTTSATTVNLTPGVYCGGIYINGNATVTLQAGTYILNGGGLYMNGNGTLNGTGVTFYNTQGFSSLGQIYFNGNETLNLSAPTSGPLQGILFFQDRTVNNPPAAYVNGNFGSTIKGALYFSKSQLYYNGNGAQNASYTIVVADTIYMNGNVNMTFNKDYSSLANGSPIKSSALYE